VEHRSFIQLVQRLFQDFKFSFQDFISSFKTVSRYSNQVFGSTGAKKNVWLDWVCTLREGYNLIVCLYSKRTKIALIQIGILTFKAF